MVFPKFSRMTEDKKEFGLAVRGTLKSMIFLLIPMTVGLMALAQPVVSLIYQRGAFDETATQLTAAALFFFALGMVGYGVQNILSRAFLCESGRENPVLFGTGFYRYQCGFVLAFAEADGDWRSGAFCGGFLHSGGGSASDSGGEAVSRYSG